MTEPSSQKPDRPLYNDLTDFVEGASKLKPLDLEVAINSDGKVILFHNLPFRKEVSWFEFDLSSNRLEFVLDDGDKRDAGLPLTKDVAKHMQNSHQILMILMDGNTGEAKEGQYIPLIIHQT